MKRNVIRISLELLVFVCMFGVLGTGCSSKNDTHKLSMEEIHNDAPKWVMDPKYDVDPSLYCGSGSGLSRKAALHDGRTDLAMAVRSELTVLAQTTEDTTSNEFMLVSESFTKQNLQNSVLKDYWFGPDKRLYVRVCIEKLEVDRKWGNLMKRMDTKTKEYNQKESEKMQYGY